MSEEPEKTRRPLKETVWLEAGGYKLAYSLASDLSGVHTAQPVTFNKASSLRKALLGLNYAALSFQILRVKSDEIYISNCYVYQMGLFVLVLILKAEGSLKPNSAS